MSKKEKRQKQGEVKLEKLREDPTGQRERRRRKKKKTKERLGETAWVTPLDAAQP